MERSISPASPRTLRPLQKCPSEEDRTLRRGEHFVGISRGPQGTGKSPGLRAWAQRSQPRGGCSMPAVSGSSRSRPLALELLFLSPGRAASVSGSHGASLEGCLLSSKPKQALCHPSPAAASGWCIWQPWEPSLYSRMPACKIPWYRSGQGYGHQRRT